MYGRMLVGLAVVLVFGGRLSAQTEEIQDQASEIRKLLGTWLFEAASQNGKPASAFRKCNVEFIKDKFYYRYLGDDGKEVQISAALTYEIDVKQKNPRGLTLRSWTLKKNEQGELVKHEEVVKAVYQV